MMVSTLDLPAGVGRARGEDDRQDNVSVCVVGVVE